MNEKKVRQDNHDRDDKKIIYSQKLYDTQTRLNS